MDVNLSFTIIQEAIPVIVAKVVAVVDAVRHLIDWVKDLPSECCNIATKM